MTDEPSGRPTSATRSVTTPIVTFYSYKGGVGRSMALANLSVLAARDFGLNVVIADWDLEAPGLHRFFGIADRDIRDGIVDFFDRYKRLLKSAERPVTDEDLSIESSLVTVRTFPSGATVRLLPAGSQSDPVAYARKLQAFDWDDFYTRWNGAQLIESVRLQLKAAGQLVFVDSRTGLTDIGGVCTMHLPDIVVLVFAFNEQNVAGTVRVARELTAPNEIFSQLQRRPELLFLPSRKEVNELDRLREWEKDAAARLAPYDHSPRVRAEYPTTLEYLKRVAIPYIPYFAYGEELAAESEQGFELVQAYTPLVRLLVGREPLNDVVRPQPKRRLGVPIATAEVPIESLVGSTDLADTQRSVVARMWKDVYDANTYDARRLRSLANILRGVAIGGSTAGAVVLTTSFGLRQLVDNQLDVAFWFTLAAAVAVLIERGLRLEERWRRHRTIASVFRNEAQHFFQLSGSYLGFEKHTETYRRFLDRASGLAQSVEPAIREPTTGAERAIDGLDLSDLDKSFIHSRWRSQVWRLKEKVRAVRMRQRMLTGAAIALTVAAPVIIGLALARAQTLYNYAQAVAGLAAITIALRQLVPPDAEWEDYQRRVDLLDREGWRFFQLTGPYSVYQRHGDAFRPFTEAVEEIISGDPADILVQASMKERRHV